MMADVLQSRRFLVVDPLPDGWQQAIHSHGDDHRVRKLQVKSSGLDPGDVIVDTFGQALTHLQDSHIKRFCRVKSLSKCGLESVAV
jgi:hypothetical protein